MIAAIGCGVAQSLYVSALFVLLLAGCTVYRAFFSVASRTYSPRQYVLASTIVCVTTFGGLMALGAADDQLKVSCEDGPK